MQSLSINSKVYRKLVKTNDLNIQSVVMKESDLLVSGICDLKEKTTALLYKYRKKIETYIQEHPFFKTSMRPIDMDNNAPDIIKTMIESALKTNVGPMASVAGAIAEYVGMELLLYSSEIIVENGGDVFIRSSKQREFMLLAESSSFVGLRVGINSNSNPLGICTSSGLLGPSTSFGKADAVMVMAKSVSLADAAATAIANIVNKGTDIEAAINRGKKIGAEGLVIIVDGRIGAWGDIEILG